MKSSLSVVLPLHNSQAVLVEKIEQLLEILPELTSRFEVVLVDDGSTDATLETAHELSLHFPQVQLIVHPARLGAQEAFRSALRYTSGDLLLACRDATSFEPHEIAKLWNRRTSEGGVFGLPHSSSPIGSIPEVPRAAAARSRAMAGAEPTLPEMLLVPRRLLVGWPGADDRLGVVAFLRAKGYPLRSVEVRTTADRPSLAKLADGIRRRMATRTASGLHHRIESAVPRVQQPIVVDRADGKPVTQASSTKRPNYLLARLKAFTLGE